MLLTKCLVSMHTNGTNKRTEVSILKTVFILIDLHVSACHMTIFRQVKYKG